MSEPQGPPEQQPYWGAGHPPPAGPQGASGEQGQRFGAPDEQPTQAFGAASGPQPGYGAPQQPGYGAPQQPGYGAPGQQPGYGAPGQQPGYGAPGQQPGYGGYGQQPPYGAPGGPGGYSPGGPGGSTPWYARWYLWVAVVLVIALTVLGIVLLTRDGGDSSPTPPPESAEPTDESTGEPTDTPTDEPTDEPTDDPTDQGGGGTPQEVVLGESATLDDTWDVTVQDPDMDATQAVVDEGNSEPSDGNIYVMVYITATNNGSEPAQVYDNIAMAYLDEDGQQFDGSNAVAPDDAFALPAVAPGEDGTGTYVFEVPEGSQGGHWLIQSRNDLDGPIFAYANN